LSRYVTSVMGETRLEVTGGPGDKALGGASPAGRDRAGAADH